MSTEENDTIFGRLIHMKSTGLDGGTYNIKRKFNVIGSSEKVNIRLIKRGIRDWHVTIVVDTVGNVFTNNIHKSNNVHVNGILLGGESHQLRHMDVLEVAGHQFRFEVGEMQSKATKTTRKSQPTPKSTKAPSNQKAAKTSGGSTKESPNKNVLVADTQKKLDSPDQSISQTKPEFDTRKLNIENNNYETKSPPTENTEQSINHSTDKIEEMRSHVHEPVIQEPVIHEPVIHDPVIHESVIHEPVIHESIENNHSTQQNSCNNDTSRDNDHLPFIMEEESSKNAIASADDSMAPPDSTLDSHDKPKIPKPSIEENSFTNPVVIVESPIKKPARSKRPQIDDSIVKQRTTRNKKRTSDASTVVDLDVEVPLPKKWKGVTDHGSSNSPQAIDRSNTSALIMSGISNEQINELEDITVELLTLHGSSKIADMKAHVRKSASIHEKVKKVFNNSGQWAIKYEALLADSALMPRLYRVNGFLQLSASNENN